jgi:hypothetical protein
MTRNKYRKIRHEAVHSPTLVKYSVPLLKSQQLHEIYNVSMSDDPVGIPAYGCRWCKNVNIYRVL